MDEFVLCKVMMVETLGTPFANLNLKGELTKLEVMTNARLRILTCEVEFILFSFGMLI